MWFPLSNTLGENIRIIYSKTEAWGSSLAYEIIIMDCADCIKLPRCIINKKKNVSPKHLPHTVLINIHTLGALNSVGLQYIIYYFD